LSALTHRWHCPFFKDQFPEKNSTNWLLEFFQRQFAQTEFRLGQFRSVRYHVETVNSVLQIQKIIWGIFLAYLQMLHELQQDI
jgi:hypothetical protein